MQSVVKILENVEFAPNIYNLTFQSKEIANIALPGQFAHIRTRDSIDPLLRRPISICDVNKETDTIRLVYRKHGFGTDILSKRKPNDMLDILAPLGNGVFPQNIDGKEVFIIGGGIGSPPLLYAAKILAANNIKVTTILGFSTYDQVILEKDFNEYGDVAIYTIDGSYGNQGLVTDYFHTKIDATIFACGPLPMLKAIKNHPYLANLTGFISLEEHMACGIGACMGCVTKVTVDNESQQKKTTIVEDHSWKYEKVCDCGPVFPMKKVVL